MRLRGARASASRSWARRGWASRGSITSSSTGPVLRDVPVLESGSVSHARAAAFHPLIDLLRIYFGVVGGDDERRIRERVIGKLLAAGRTAPRDFGAVADLARRAAGRRRFRRPGSRAAPTPDPRCLPHPAASRGRCAADGGDLRGPALGGRGNPRLPRSAGRRRRPLPPAAAVQLSPRVRRSLDRTEPLRPRPHRSPARGEQRRITGRPLGHGRGAGRSPSRPDGTDGGLSLLYRGNRAGPGRGGRAGG